MEKRNCLFKSYGFEIRDLVIPTFEVAEESIICLHLPDKIPLNILSDFAEKIRQMLLDGKGVAGSVNPARIQSVNSFEMRKRFSFFRKKITVKDKICEMLGDFDDISSEFLDAYNMDANRLYLDGYGATEKFLLRLFASLRLNDLIVIGCFGLDPQGFEKIANFVKKNSKGKGIIYFSGKHTDGTRKCFEMNSCYEIVRKTD